jgi:hypothetical protein
MSYEKDVKSHERIKEFDCEPIKEERYEEGSRLEVEIIQ